MRALKTKDLRAFSKIIDKLDLKNELDGLFVTIDGKGLTEREIAQAQDQANYELGIKLMALIVEKYWKAEKEVYTLLADLTDKTVKDIEDLPVDEFIDLLKQVKEDKSFDSFFKLVTQ